jgi:hypothetical protein
VIIVDDAYGTTITTDATHKHVVHHETTAARIKAWKALDWKKIYAARKIERTAQLAADKVAREAQDAAAARKSMKGVSDRMGDNGPPSPDGMDVNGNPISGMCKNEADVASCDISVTETPGGAGLIEASLEATSRSVDQYGTGFSSYGAFLHNQVKAIDPVVEPDQGAVQAMEEWMTKLGGGFKNLAKATAGLSVAVVVGNDFQQEFSDGPSRGRSLLTEILRGSAHSALDVGGAYGGGLVGGAAGGFLGEAVFPPGGGVPTGVAGAITGSILGEFVGDLLFQNAFP